MWTLLVQVEETTREREERLKGWSSFLEGGDPSQRKDTVKPAEGTTTTEPTQPCSTAEPGQPPGTELKQQEQDADSTDSSLAGSDGDEA